MLGPGSRYWDVWRALGCGASTCGRCRSLVEFLEWEPLCSRWECPGHPGVSCCGAACQTLGLMRGQTFSLVLLLWSCRPASCPPPDARRLRLPPSGQLQVRHEGRERRGGPEHGGGCGWVPGAPEAGGGGGRRRGAAQLQSLSALLTAGAPERRRLHPRGCLSGPQVDPPPPPPPHPLPPAS
ncbi:unnamed protein product [Tetraodon nigroviridis]|uniref:(spotted green pufferfish) hypothetical protein n=1 Tax=Tetraodon nigroviridis TaxID=99883 RepID=Q4TAF5_TETNG|nr:unnamed protein product [Tetraodon nigroviridis]